MQILIFLGAKSPTFSCISLSIMLWGEMSEEHLEILNEQIVSLKALLQNMEQYVQALEHKRESLLQEMQELNKEIQDLAEKFYENCEDGNPPEKQ